MFPKDFVWGAATASYQIEGAVNEDGRVPSIWDTFSATPGNVENGDTGAVACDHYHRYKEDVALMKQLGLKAYRFSIAWGRVLNGQQVNQRGLDFYSRLVDELLAAHIQPWVTLYHWDLPQNLQDEGGWTNRAIVEKFAHYADVVTRALGDRVKHWITFNEPWVFTYLGYGIGYHAPGISSLPAYLSAAHHFLLSHARSVPIIRGNSPDSKVGVTLDISQPEGDPRAVARQRDFHNHWFLDPIYFGEYPQELFTVYQEMGYLPDIQDGDLEAIQGKPDFLGINYYTRQVVEYDESDPLHLTRWVHQPESEYTEMGWEVAPESIYRMLKYINDRYAPDAMVITENGAAFADEVSDDGQVHDPRRVAFYDAYLRNCLRAIQEGVPLKGYFAWSLLDNFEWAFGYSKRFGIIYVDYETQQRIPKDSAKWYSQLIKRNGFE
ncbi:MAG: beta-glucosidase [Phototrophicales bacterium]|nr:MAG: beta-glucosidase [Phototrophicales bacterium]RMG74129.1 MAG: beta-glucosidase [Chloroflexota bacterium]